MSIFNERTEVLKACHVKVYPKRLTVILVLKSAKRFRVSERNNITPLQLYTKGDRRRCACF